MSFEKLGLRAELLKAAESRGYTAPTPIQTGVIPAILGGRDVFARAQTGTGKTDAFALPLVELLSRENGSGRHPRALVLTPTRELALQVGESIKAYARRVSLRCTVVYGGVRITPQVDRLRRGIDILVATPGRLLDLAGRRCLNLSRIAFLVFDEADRMLDLGFSREITDIIERVPAKRRTMLFSATYSQPIRDLAGRMLQEPAHIEVTPGNAAAEPVVQKVHLVDRSNKSALLIHLITRGDWTRVLVFTRTRRGADKLADKLTDKGIRAAALHSSKNQSFRTRTLEAFKSGEIRTLVATDVAARGLDISRLPHVVNYDVPRSAEDYIHRVGRTGRAGVRGIAVSLVSHDEKPHLQAIEKLLGQKIPVETVPGYTEDSAIPDFVLFRPDSPSSEDTADKDLKDIVDRRKAAKQRSRTRTAKARRSGRRGAARSGTGRKNQPAGKRGPRSGSGPRRSSPKGKPGGKR